MSEEQAQMLGDIRDIAAEIGSRSKVYELIGSGDLKAVKVGRRTKILMSSLHDYIARLPEAKIAPSRRRTSKTSN